MTNKTFLVEIGTEELPAKTLRSIAEAFAANFSSALETAGLTRGELNWFATPRRLALKVKHLSTMQPEREIKKRGPSIQASFDINGIPTTAAKNWAKSCGITVEQAECLKTDKGAWLIHTMQVTGQKTKTLLPKMITASLMQLPILKQMRWGLSKIQFVRPIHTITLLLGDEVILEKILGINSSRILRGHRFMGDYELTIKNADEYPYLLINSGKVQPNFEIRKKFIKDNVEQAASRIGGIAKLNNDLLEEVTALVEWPVILTAKFEEKFLLLPEEALLHTLTIDQKYFPVYNKKGKLLSKFIFVTNIESKDPYKIILGNERVIRPRLADAVFFFNNDLKLHLEQYLPKLGKVLFHKNLGTMLDKTNRIQCLSTWIASQIGADVKNTSRAALLSKCDLMTNMVFEFTETQGIMGMHYARYYNEVEDVAIALKEQYQPRFSEDKLPSNLVSCALAIADKIDTIVGMYGIGQRPKGDKDPFALRRAALGILRIIVEKNLSLDLQNLTEKTVKLYGNLLKNTKVIEEVIDFILNRFPNWYLEKGFTIDKIQAVLAIRPTCPQDFNARINAIAYFCTLREATNLAIANKRVSKILDKGIQLTLYENIKISLLKENDEIKLAECILSIKNKLTPLLIEGRYKDALIEMATLSEVIDKFFINVMVNVKEIEIRINRLTLLSNLRNLFLKVGDISLLKN